MTTPEFIYKPPENSLSHETKSVPMRKLSQEEWEENITKWMERGGWKKDRDDETTLGFSYVEGEHHWIRDYDKKEKRFFQFDGNVRINIKITKNDKA